MCTFYKDAMIEIINLSHQWHNSLIYLKFGKPIGSKLISEMLYRLQKHNFDFVNETATPEFATVFLVQFSAKLQIFWKSCMLFYFAPLFQSVFKFASVTFLVLHGHHSEQLSYELLNLGKNCWKRTDWLCLQRFFQSVFVFVILKSLFGHSYEVTFSHLSTTMPSSDLRHGISLFLITWTHNLLVKCTIVEKWSILCLVSKSILH